MTPEREAEIIEQLSGLRSSEVAQLLVEFLANRREGYRDQLERNCNEVTRGKVLECRDIMQLFS